MNRNRGRSATSPERAATPRASLRLKLCCSSDNSTPAGTAPRSRRVNDEEAGDNDARSNSTSPGRSRPNTRPAPNAGGLADGTNATPSGGQSNAQLCRCRVERAWGAVMRAIPRRHRAASSAVPLAAHRAAVRGCGHGRGGGNNARGANPELAGTDGAGGVASPRARVRAGGGGGLDGRVFAYNDPRVAIRTPCDGEMAPTPGRGGGSGGGGGRGVGNRSGAVWGWPMTASTARARNTRPGTGWEREGPGVGGGGNGRRGTEEAGGGGTGGGVGSGRGTGYGPGADRWGGRRAPRYAGDPWGDPNGSANGNPMAVAAEWRAGRSGTWCAHRARRR
jgi:hypothetical protein